MHTTLVRVTVPALRHPTDTISTSIDPTWILAEWQGALYPRRQPRKAMPDGKGDFGKLEEA
ncbi:hypothetical protein [Bradyrhizobium sp. UFLA05-112]